MRTSVYVLYSIDHDRLYIGQTSNLAARLESHLRLSKKGFTSRLRPWVLIHIETFDSGEKARSREKELKGGRGRVWIRNNIVAVLKKGLRSA